MTEYYISTCTGCDVEKIDFLARTLDVGLWAIWLLHWIVPYFVSYEFAGFISRHKYAQLVSKGLKISHCSINSTYIGLVRCQI